MYEVYEEVDAVLPQMKLEQPCGIRIEIHDDSINLYVGRRDWSWDRKSGNLLGAGTELEHPIADDSPSTGEDAGKP